MDQIKNGAFLETHTKEKNLTQEQAAEQLGVSNRTVSRWETGTNMPDIWNLVSGFIDRRTNPREVNVYV